MRRIRLLLTAFGLALPAHLPAAEKANIVYILCDDLGYGDVQCLNPKRGKIATPNIDRLAAQGMAFTEAHSSSAVCTPTRYGILTGRYAWRTRLHQGVLSNYDQPLIAPDRLTVPALLKQHGYHTACIGKWHLGFTVDQTARGAGKPTGAPLGARTADGPTTRGFDYFYGFHHARMMESVFENDRVTELLEPVALLPRLTERATNYIATRAATQQPFFLYLALSSPHTPIVPSAPWVGKSGLGRYGDFVMETDGVVGRILAALKESGIESNTLVIFTSDNGCSPAADTKSLEARGHFASENRRGYKADIFDGGHRVPFIARWPGQIKAGTTSAQLVCLNDLLATGAEIVGAKLPANAGEDSVSLLPVFRDPHSAIRTHVVHHSINGSFAIREGPWKLALCAGSGGWSNPKPGSPEVAALPAAQLYEMSQDGGERANQFNEHPEIVTRLRKLLAQIVADGRSTPGPQQKNDRSVAVDKKPTKDHPN